MGGEFVQALRDGFDEVVEGELEASCFRNSGLGFWLYRIAQFLNL